MVTLTGNKIKPLDNETKTINLIRLNLAVGLLLRLVKLVGVILQFCSALLNMLAFLKGESTYHCKLVATVPNITHEEENM